LGSVRKIIDNMGAVKDAIVYDAFGNIVSETDSTKRGLYSSTGREFDVETQLRYHRARYYDPVTARWTSQDPMGFDAGDSNLYRYVNNRPTDNSDPSGQILDASIGVITSYNLQGGWRKKVVFNPTWVLPPIPLLHVPSATVSGKASIAAKGEASGNFVNLIAAANMSFKAGAEATFQWGKILNIKLPLIGAKITFGAGITITGSIESDEVTASVKVDGKGSPSVLFEVDKAFDIILRLKAKAFIGGVIKYQGQEAGLAVSLEGSVKQVIHVPKLSFLVTANPVKATFAAAAGLTWDHPSGQLDYVWTRNGKRHTQRILDFL
jgi:RHS repeat-associated protein